MKGIIVTRILGADLSALLTLSNNPSIGVKTLLFAHTSPKLTDKNASGRTVHQMLFNAQSMGGGWFGNGGNSWLRLLEFAADGKTVRVNTFSPLFDIPRY